MSNPISTCCSCGYSWLTGTNGSHSCSSILQQKLKCLEPLFFELKRQASKLDISGSYIQDFNALVTDDIWQQAVKYDQVVKMPEANINKCQRHLKNTQPYYPKSCPTCGLGGSCVFNLPNNKE